jgi:hypothetical protein
MKRAQLIELLTLAELPQSFKVEKMTIHQLRDEAKKKNIKGIWGLKREQLVDILFPKNVDKAAPDQDEQDQGKTQEHHDPDNHNPENVGVEDM